MKHINLLPKPKQEELYYERLYQGMRLFIVIVVISFAAVFVLQFTTRLYLNRQITQSNRQIEQLSKLSNKQENIQLKNEIKSINADISDFTNLAAMTPRWSKVLLAFAEHVPTGIRINSFAGDLNKKELAIRGLSPTRDQVIELYNNVKADSADFPAIDYPLENVSKATNVFFHFTMSIDDSLLQQP